MKRLLNLFVLTLFAGMSYITASANNSTEESQTKSTLRAVSPMFGINESGGEFAAVYPGIDGTHYGYPNYQDLKYVADKGFGLIRLPFRWERVQRSMRGELESNEIQKIKQVLGYATELNLKVIFDMHNFGRYCTYCNGVNSNDNVYAVIGEASCTVSDFCDVWRKLAEVFKNYDCIYGYEIMNEPYSMLRSTPWYDIAQACIYAIREVDNVTPIIIDGDSFASASMWPQVSDNLKNLTDPAGDLIYEAHTYFDHDSSGTYQGSYDSEGAHPNTGVDRLRPFVNWCKENSVMGLVGEYSVPDNDSRWLTVLDNALHYLYENGMGGTYWSAGHRWGNTNYAVHPTENYTKDRPQMAILEKYIFTATSIDNIDMDSSVFNTGNNAVYNLSGQKVDSGYKGIVICGGKKYVQK